MASSSPQSETFAFAAANGLSSSRPLAPALATTGSPGLGYSMAVLSVICNAAGIHLFRYVLDYTNPYTLMPINTLFSVIAMLLMGVIWRRCGW